MRVSVRPSIPCWSQPKAKDAPGSFHQTVGCSSPVSSCCQQGKNLLMRICLLLLHHHLFGSLPAGILQRRVGPLLEESSHHLDIASFGRLVQGIGAAEEGLLRRVHSGEALLLQPRHDLILELHSFLLRALLLFGSGGSFVIFLCLSLTLLLLPLALLLLCLASLFQLLRLLLCYETCSLLRCKLLFDALLLLDLCIRIRIPLGNVLHAHLHCVGSGVGRIAGRCAAEVEHVVLVGVKIVRLPCLV
mmetsp:Transcript_14117/g.33642  ORF Transcript_14117/g.33642 Transcript_14117/m.33642 type:complete len:246 (-) Transcript_14117:35-772(-)